MTLPRTKDEMMEYFSTEYFDLYRMIIVVDGYDEVLEFNRDMEAPYPEEIHFRLPEFSTYTLTLEYKVKKRKLHNFQYRHAVKKRGFTFKSRMDVLNEVAEVNTDEFPLHRVSLRPEKLPGGSLIRGVYPATSTFIEDGSKTPLYTIEWKIEIIKQDEPPSVKGL